MRFLKYIVDIHTHTIASGHAYSTIDENTRFAKIKGIKLIAMTDHAPALVGAPKDIYFHNLKVIPKILNDVEILKGAELNIIDYNGNIDLDEYALKKLDIRIASLHTPCIDPKTIDDHTNAYIKACENKYINVLGHPGDPRYPFYVKDVLDACERTGTLIEINNASLRPNGSRKGSDVIMKEIVNICKKREMPIVLGTDAHFYTEIGDFSLCEKFLSEMDFPDELVLNTSVEKFKEYIEKQNNTSLL